MIWLSGALVVLGGFGLLAFRWWLRMSHGDPNRAQTSEMELYGRYDRRISAIEERLSTIELQRAILRKVPDK